MLKLKATAKTYIFLYIASKPSIKNLLAREGAPARRAQP
jgi:hypothetical protein